MFEKYDSGVGRRDGVVQRLRLLDTNGQLAPSPHP
jgi:hypothetical protein